MIDAVNLRLNLLEQSPAPGGFASLLTLRTGLSLGARSTNLTGRALGASDARLPLDPSRPRLAGSALLTLEAAGSGRPWGPRRTRETLKALWAPREIVIGHQIRSVQRSSA